MSKFKTNRLFEGNWRQLLIAAIFIIPLFSFAAAQGNRRLERDNSSSSIKESRIALVIGNGNYVDSPLRNPVNDATDVAAALKTLGFEVLSYTDLDQNGMKKAIREFGARLRANGGVGLFYYAGHGVQVKGANYLIPVSAEVQTEEEVEYESVEVGLVLAQMESAKNNMNIVILDACRNNPFARSYRSADKGLASIDAPSGTLIAYSTAPGSVASDGNGRNGLYTQELLKQIQTKNLTIEDVFKRVRAGVQQQTQGKQTPWESSSLVNDFYFASDQNKPVKPAARQNQQAQQNFPSGNADRQDPPSTAQPKNASGSLATKKEVFFTFEIQKCVKAGTAVICDFTVTNDDSQDRPFEFSDINPSGMIDDRGYEARARGIEVGNKRGTERTIMIPNVPVKGKITFQGVAEDAREIKRMLFAFSTKLSPSIVSGFKVEFRDIPLQ
jgi:hypothetical protein